MTESVRKALCELLWAHGQRLHEDPRRLRMLLTAECPGEETAINWVVAAAEERLPERMLEEGGLQRKSMVTRLRTRRRLTDEAALWTVETWALAFGLISAKELTPVSTQQRAPVTIPTASTPYEPAGPVTAPTPWIVAGVSVLIACASMAYALISSHSAHQARGGPVVQMAQPGPWAVNQPKAVSLAPAPKPSPERTLVKLCASGYRAGDYCSDTHEERLAAGEIPPLCTQHTAPSETVQICSLSGRKAGPGCPQSGSESRPVDRIPELCTQHPQPSLAVSGLPRTMSVGSTYEFYLEAQNQGRTVREGSITVSTPDSAQIACTQVPAGWDRPQRDVIGVLSSSDPTVVTTQPPQGAGAEAYFVGLTWAAGGTRRATFTVTPLASGTLRLYTRCTLSIRKAESALWQTLGGRFFTAPDTSETRDEQGYPVEIHTIQVD